MDAAAVLLVACILYVVCVGVGGGKHQRWHVHSFLRVYHAFIQTAFLCSVVALLGGNAVPVSKEALRWLVSDAVAGTAAVDDDGAMAGLGVAVSQDQAGTVTNNDLRQMLLTARAVVDTEYASALMAWAFAWGGFWIIQGIVSVSTQRVLLGPFVRGPFRANFLFTTTVVSSMIQVLGAFAGPVPTTAAALFSFFVSLVGILMAVVGMTGREKEAQMQSQPQAPPCFPRMPPGSRAVCIALLLDATCQIVVAAMIEASNPNLHATSEEMIILFLLRAVMFEVWVCCLPLESRLVASMEFTHTSGDSTVPNSRLSEAPDGDHGRDDDDTSSNSGDGGMGGFTQGLNPWTLGKLSTPDPVRSRKASMPHVI